MHPSVAAANLLELISTAKSRPGQLNYASTGIGNQLAAELLNMMSERACRG
ncbi:MAG: tripartite tricarboxylate transporter substrate-binding protein [Pseudomonadota bacterium]